MPDVLTERHDHVLLVTLNRPERMNSIGGTLLRELSEALTEAELDREIRVVLLTGAGRGFCSGLDLKEVAARGAGVGSGAALPSIADTPPLLMRRLDTPILCAMNGPAAGYGMDLALGCDLLLVSDRARFVPPIRRGVLPESGGTWLLPRLVGWQKACEIALLGRELEAAEIERLGLANRVVPHDRLMDEAMDWATTIAGSPPLAVAATKRSMRFGLDATFEANAAHVMAELMQLFQSADFAEGLASFLEKRPPRFEGR